MFFLLLYSECECVSVRVYVWYSFFFSSGNCVFPVYPGEDSGYHNLATYITLMCATFFDFFYQSPSFRFKRNLKVKLPDRKPPSWGFTVGLHCLHSMHPWCRSTVDLYQTSRISQLNGCLYRLCISWFNISPGRILMWWRKTSLLIVGRCKWLDLLLYVPLLLTAISVT